MPGPIQKDSMSRCETPSMLYDTIRRPNAPYVPPKPAIDPSALTKDTIETTQQRLNREVLERFQNTSSRMPHHSFVVAAQVGKYLFLAIMLPTYICFFGIPRWLLTNALPQIFATIKTETLRVGRFFNELAKQVVDTMKGVIEQLIGDSLRMLNQQTKNFFTHIFQKVSNLAKSVQQFAQAIRQYTENIYSLLLRAKEKTINEVDKFLLKLESLKDRAVRLAKNTIYAFLQPLDLADKYILQPILEWGTKKAAAIANGIRTYGIRAYAIKLTANAAMRLLKKVSQPIISSIREAVKTIYYSARQNSKYILKQVFSWLQPYVDNKQTGIDRFRKTISRGVLKIASAIRDKTKKTISTLVEVIRPVIQLPVQVAVQFTGWAWWQISQAAKAPWKYFKRGANGGKRALMFISHSLAGGAKSLSRKMQFLAKGALYGFFWFLAWAKLAIYWLAKQLIALPRKALQGLMILLKMSVRVVKSCIYGLRILAAWSWVILSCGMTLVRELTHEIGSWFRS